MRNKNLSYPYNVFVTIFNEPSYGIETRFDCTVCAKLKELIETDIALFMRSFDTDRSKGEQRQRLFLMYYRDNLTYREIALKEGYNNNHQYVHSIVQRAVFVLAKNLRMRDYREYIGYGRVSKCYDQEDEIQLMKHEYGDNISSDKVINSLINDYYNDDDKRKMSIYLSAISDQLDKI